MATTESKEDNSMSTVKEIIMEKHQEEQAAFPFHNTRSKNYRDNIKHKSQIRDDAVVIKKSGKYTLEIAQAGIVVTDGWLTDWVTVYNNGTWAHDGTFGFPKSLKDYLDTSSLQVAPQEMENINYQSGVVDMDTLEGFKFSFND